MLLARGRYLSGTSNDEMKIASKNFKKKPNARIHATKILVVAKNLKLENRNTNPTDSKGNTSRYNVCDSIFH